MPAGGVLDILGGSPNITTSGAGNAVTISLSDSPSVTGSLAAGTTITAGTAITAGTQITATAGDIIAASGDLRATTGNVIVGGEVNAEGRVTAGNGTANLPSLTFGGNFTTGLSAENVNTLVASTDGIARLTIGSTGMATFANGVTITPLGAGVVQSNSKWRAELIKWYRMDKFYLAVVKRHIMGKFDKYWWYYCVHGWTKFAQPRSTKCISRSFATDAGTAVPDAGVLSVLGGSNLNTSATGSTVFVNLNNALL